MKTILHYRYLVATMMVFGVTLVLWPLRESLDSRHFSLIYLLLVLVSAINQGIGPSLYAGLLSFLCFNFFLVKPFYTFVVSDPRDLVNLLIYLAVAGLTGQLASYARNQRRSAEQRAAELNILYAAATTFNHLSDQEDVLQALKHILFTDLDACLVEMEGNFSSSLAEAGCKSPPLDLPLEIDGRTYHLLRVKFAEALSPSSIRLAQACAAQAAVALQRIELIQAAQESRTFEEADKLKTALLHAVSHDLRTPITIIKTSAGNLSRLEDTLPKSARRDMLDVIEAEADQLNNMVGNLLDISRLEAGAMQINSALNSLEEVTGDVAARMWQLTHEERIEMRFPPDMPLVRFDYGLILQALTNLVDNSVRYEPPGQKVQIVGQIVGQEARIAVINHGPAVPIQDRTLVFEPFYHGPDGHIGLGLAISKGIVEAHRGRVWIEDTPSGGATFIIGLPRS